MYHEVTAAPHDADQQLVERIASGDVAALTRFMTQNNRRLFRITWSILKHREDAEDALQSAYLRAFASIQNFRGAASLDTWVTRIVINEALTRRRSLRRVIKHLFGNPACVAARYQETMMQGSAGLTEQGTRLSRQRTLQLMESALAQIPEKFRTIFVLREVEELNIAEVAVILNLPAATVKTRHLRAKRKLQQLLPGTCEELMPEAISFAGADCAELTARVLAAHLASVDSQTCLSGGRRARPGATLQSRSVGLGSNQ